MAEINNTSIKSTPSVTIRHAYKRYAARNVILNGLNLTVPEKSIYGLLGSSGCGKTTLLNCIVGKICLDDGYINLKIKKRSDIGYMPQNLALHDRMTIEENFCFYGGLYGMSGNEIKERSKDLMSLLELPSSNNFVEALSGGQQRRVSIAIALIHDPKIVVLDEPTVGLDPLLSQSIWNRLLEMAHKGKSIIITTHYIQEANQAHTIGLMREGKLLAEESPLRLMEKCECNNLEEAFLILSYRQEADIRHKITNYPEESKQIKAYYEDDIKRFSQTKFRALTYKNFTLLKREYVFFVFLLILPVLQIVLFNVAIGGKPKDLNLAIINDEVHISKCSSSYNKQCLFTETGYNENITLSCLFLHFLRRESYNFIDYVNESQALDALRRNKVWALLHFNKNYTSSLVNRFIDGIRVSEKDLLSSSVVTWIDLSNQYIGNFIKFDIARSILSFLRQIMINCEINAKAASIPLNFENPLFGSIEGSFLGYASSTLLCIVCFFFPMILSAGLLLTEKIGGMLERMMVAGVTITEMLSSAVAMQILIHIIQTFLAMIVMYGWFDNPLEGSIVAIWSLMMLIGISGMFFGFMLGVVNKDMMSSSYFGIGMNLALCLTTGLLWPTEGAHYILKSVNWLLPLTWTTESARALCIKSLSFFHPLVLGGFAFTIVWNVIFVLIICLFIKYKKDGLIVNC